MGTHMAALHATLFMDRLQQKFLFIQIKKPLFWWHYLDDVFALWTHNIADLETFLQLIN